MGIKVCIKFTHGSTQLSHFENRNAWFLNRIALKFIIMKEKKSYLTKKPVEQENFKWLHAGWAMEHRILLLVGDLR